MVIISTVVLAVLLLASSVRAVGPPDAPPTDGPTDAVAYTVAAGDTLWAIAGRLAGPGQDRRPVVSEIRRINALEGSLIHPGQTLLVPTN
jgi:LysM repeat protein